MHRHNWLAVQAGGWLHVPRAWVVCGTGRPRHKNMPWHNVDWKSNSGGPWVHMSVRVSYGYSYGYVCGYGYGYSHSHSKWLVLLPGQGGALGHWVHHCTHLPAS